MDLGVHYAVVLPLLSIIGLLGALANIAVRDYKGHKELLQASLVMIIVGWIIYTIPFLTLDYRLGEVARNSSDGLNLLLRWATSWSGGGSSLYFFTTIVAATALYLMRRGSNTLFTATINLVILVTMVSAVLNGAFDVVSVRGGIGFNPILKSYWVLPHPTSTFGGYAILLVAGLALYSGITGSRVLALFLTGWSLLTLGITFGGYWSYETFGWGGYWAWDPVEVAELTVWLAATAVLHSVGPLSGLRRPMLLLLASSVPLGLYVTRSGLSPLHSFAAANIGAIVLLSLSIGFLGMMLYLVASSREVHAVVDRVTDAFKGRSLPGVAVAVAGSALIIAGVFVYSSLLTPSILTAMGIEASIPTMAGGVRFYHPILYPLIITALLVLPGYFLSRETGWRGFALHLSTVLLVGVLSAYMAWREFLPLAPEAPAATRVMMAFGLVAAGAVAGLLLISLVRNLSRRGAAYRSIVLKVIHLGMSIALVGVLLSGTYAFNDAYFKTYKVPLGEEVEVLPGVTIVIEDYSFEQGSGSIDLADHVAGKTTTSILAWNSIILLQEDIAPAIREVKLAMEEARTNTSIRMLRDLVLQSPLTLDRVEITGIGRLIMGDAASGENVTLLEASQISVVVLRPNVSIDLVPRVGDTGRIEGAWLGVSITGESAEIEFNSTSITAGGVHSYYIVEFGNGYNLSVGNVTISIGSLVLYPGVEDGRPLVEASSLGIVLGSPYIVMDSGVVYYGGLSFSSPGSYERGVYMYIEIEKGEASILENTLSSSLAEYLSSKDVLSRLSTPTPRDMPLPDKVLENVKLKLRMKIIQGAREEVVEPVIRFEANGEAIGIHGLVIDTVIIRQGIDDIYMSIQPPQIEGYFNEYHEPIIYYLKEAKKDLNPAEYIALVALMSAGYNIGNVRGTDITTASLQVEQYMVDMYLLAEKYNPENSNINTEGVTIQVKVVPGVNLLWAGAGLMALGGILSALVYTRVPGR